MYQLRSDVVNGEIARGQIKMEREGNCSSYLCDILGVSRQELADWIV